MPLKTSLEKEFDLLEQYFNDNKFDKIVDHKRGIYFLKIRSISRITLLRDFATKNKINIPATKNNKKNLFKFLFCTDIPEQIIDKYLKDNYKVVRKNLIGDEDFLYSQLYKLEHFSWGGFYQNAVEQTIVNNYVKKIKDFKKLSDIIERDIQPRIRDYTLSSWYNHWTSLLIEDIFNTHPDIIPCSGLIKKIDFFWNNFPFDLKVTYFPYEFMELKRKERGLNSELQELKSFAKKNKIKFNQDANPKELFIELYTRISEDYSRTAQSFIKNLQNERKSIIQSSTKKPKELIKWLYESQGIRRFDAANRFFIILADLRNLSESWKLKRNKNLLKKEIWEFLNSYRNIDFNKLMITFKWENKQYTSYSHCLFIIIEK
jgi:septum formation topological specificity factor MinE